MDIANLFHLKADRVSEIFKAKQIARGNQSKEALEDFRNAANLRGNGAKRAHA